MPTTKPRVCVIGAGPSGCATLYNFAELEGSDEMPEISCFEKQDDWGGMWNYDWRTGVDRYGEPQHGSMYRHLWSNGPKEAIELPDYSFERHFGKPTPSYAPRAAILDYLTGRWRQRNLKRFVFFLSFVFCFLFFFV